MSKNRKTNVSLTKCQIEALLKHGASDVVCPAEREKLLAARTALIDAATAAGFNLPYEA